MIRQRWFLKRQLKKSASFTSTVWVNNTENLVLLDSLLRYSVSDIYTLVSVMRERIDGLYSNSENSRSGIQDLKTTLVADLGI